MWPVAGLPEETLAHGGKLAIVNRDPTRYDARAALVVHASAGETLGAVLRCCALERPLDEDVRATRADLPLDLVGDARTLHDHVHLLRDVLVGRTLGAHRHHERYIRSAALRLDRKGEFAATSR